MKAIRVLLVSFFVLCALTTNVVASKKSDKNSVIDQTYTQAQEEVLETFGAIAGSIIAGAGHGLANSNFKPEECILSLTALAQQTASRASDQPR